MLEQLVTMAYFPSIDKKYFKKQTLRFLPKWIGSEHQDPSSTKLNCLFNLYCFKLSDVKLMI